MDVLTVVMILSLGKNSPITKSWKDTLKLVTVAMMITRFYVDATEDKAVILADLAEGFLSGVLLVQIIRIFSEYKTNEMVIPSWIIPIPSLDPTPRSS